MEDIEQDQEWPTKLYILHPSVKSFGDMVYRPERKLYILADAIPVTVLEALLDGR